VNNPKAFYLKELSDKSKVPIATTYRILQKLEKLKIIQVMKISKFKLYTLSSNQDTEFLSSLFLDKKNAVDIFISKAKKEPSVESILLQGEEEEDKANLINLLNIGRLEKYPKEGGLIIYLKRNEDSFEFKRSLTKVKEIEKHTVFLDPEMA